MVTLHGQKDRLLGNFSQVNNPEKNQQTLGSFSAVMMHVPDGYVLCVESIDSSNPTFSSSWLEKETTCYWAEKDRKAGGVTTAP